MEVSIFTLSEKEQDVLVEVINAVYGAPEQGTDKGVEFGPVIIEMTMEQRDAFEKLFEKICLSPF